MRPLLEINGLRKEFITPRTNITALADIYMTVAKGEFVCLVGPSGCGKTTLLRLIAGLERPTAGTVSVLGNEVLEPGRQCGMVFQEPRLFPWLTVAENIGVGIKGRLAASDLQKAVSHHLELIGLMDFAQVYPRELSGGMAQRVAIARALAIDPEILLLDEPFSTLDALTRRRMQDEILQLWRATGKTMIMVTHDIHEAIHLGERVLVFSPSPGRITHIFDVGKEKRLAQTTDSQNLIDIEREIMSCLNPIN
ncbi:ABC-type nitrate/sulfonate/bicarbonate transport system, ATPase component [Desulfitobacterium dehalogenans ATCC 51507]|uniref:ABC-type nitrate/sulfonate/bicarbonate transport system, ATPase component n=1 Tax=Desulfitobacterium dehalogenans (strain ATCC 51507 / DSM 9161 / JW/IU-DC1) TaxID=756499 RepID=I4ABM0_DESDJ|nr:ABC transporter ATP-binding protein [Desulfitobacterium dehalogenans]AFM01355.1 ABC-type nitrate/sulfonate/bicarbonate transport system, ATPase component [Desulfitobacterium dehalogenans ATCC 51507]